MIISFFFNFNFYYFVVSEEDISRLKPDLLLYRASEAHNLPVMCHALALGANVNWINTECNNRVALHQAIVSVSLIIIIQVFNYIQGIRANKV